MAATQTPTETEYANDTGVALNPRKKLTYAWKDHKVNGGVETPVETWELPASSSGIIRIRVSGQQELMSTPNIFEGSYNYAFRYENGALFLFNYGTQVFSKSNPNWGFSLTASGSEVTLKVKAHLAIPAINTIWWTYGEVEVHQG